MHPETTASDPNPPTPDRVGTRNAWSGLSNVGSDSISHSTYSSVESTTDPNGGESDIIYTTDFGEWEENSLLSVTLQLRSTTATAFASEHFTYGFSDNVDFLHLD